MEIAEWLHSLGLGQYTRAFNDNAVDWKILPRLTSDDLREIGVAAVGHRRRLLEAISAYPTPSYRRIRHRGLHPPPLRHPPEPSGVN